MARRLSSETTSGWQTSLRKNGSFTDSELALFSFRLHRHCQDVAQLEERWVSINAVNLIHFQSSVSIPPIRTPLGVSITGNCGLADARQDEGRANASRCFQHDTLSYPIGRASNSRGTLDLSGTTWKSLCSLQNHDHIVYC